jgi:hypothetical protein
MKPFLMTPQQHRDLADRLEDKGPELAQQHRNVARLIEARLMAIAQDERIAARESQTPPNWGNVYELATHPRARKPGSA